MVHRSLVSGLMLCAGISGLLACSQPNDITEPAKELGSSTSGIGKSEDALLAAAEPFEALTEEAQSADGERLSKLMADTKAAVATVAAKLAPGELTKLENTLTTIASARRNNDRTGIALAAVEGYRVLIDSTNGNGAIPKAVSLLDYAGFRYQADIAASPLRWDDAGLALRVATREWDGLEPKVKDLALRDKVSKALSTMRKALDAKDAATARQAVAHELDLVDLLENYFSAKP